jgi:hypothetical protein
MGGVSVQYQSRLGSGANPDTAAPHASRPFSEADEVSRAAASDLKIARCTRANLLVVGPQLLVKNVLNLMAPGGNRDAVMQGGEGRLQLPASPRPLTMVIQDVDMLTTGEQCRLLEWLDGANIRTQVISTASTPLLARVEARTFNETLYYRLNTTYIDLFED